jgi:hypothetical protein
MNSWEGGFYQVEILPFEQGGLYVNTMTIIKFLMKQSLYSSKD